jgi:hypothetical protein
MENQPSAKTAQGGVSAAQNKDTANVSPSAVSLRQNTEMLKELLVAYGLSATKDNTELLKSLMLSGESASKGNLLKLNQLVKLFTLNTTNSGEGAVLEGDALKAQMAIANTEKALFSLRNQLPANNETVSALNRFLSESNALGKSISGLTLALGTLTDTGDILGQNRGANMGNTIFNKLAEIFLGESIKPNSPGNTSAHEALKTGAQNKTLWPDLPPEIKDLSVKLESIKNIPMSDLPEQLNKLPQSAREFIMNSLKTSGDTELLALANKLSANVTGEALKITKEEAGKLFQLLDDAMFKPDESEVDRTIQNMSKKEILDKITEKLTLKPKDNNLENMEKLLSDIKNKTGEALKYLTDLPEKPEELFRLLNNVKDNMEFMGQIKTCTYVPIPLNMPKGQVEGELYVFKDQKKTRAGQATSALIGLNTVNLNRVEAYVQKNGSNLNIQFRLTDMDVAKIISANTGKLLNLLSEAHLNISALSVIPIDEPFKITENEPTGQNVSYDLNSLTFDKKA